MYGLVNDSFREMIVERHGEASWRSIVTRADVSQDFFVADEGYDDAVTYSLLAAASEELSLSPGELLEGFGERWVLVTARQRYAYLLRPGGGSLREFLLNLPTLHARIKLVFPHLEPPTFACSFESPEVMRLEYRSHRQGLQPFVLGLLRGLAIHFETPVAIEHVQRRDEARDFDVFELRWSVDAP